MKILFSADWHIKLNQKNVPYDWQYNRFRLFFDKVTAIDCNIHIVGGDLFDKAPTLDELALFFEFVKLTKAPTYIYDGNHEATKKGKTFLHKLKSVCGAINSNVHIVEGSTGILDPSTGKTIDIIPYTDIHTFNPEDYTSDVLCTHVRGEIPPHVKPEIDLAKLSRWKTVLAGDLHSHSNSQKNILYPGSPMSVSFHRSEVRTGVLLFDTENHSYDWIDLGLPQLYRKTVNSESEIVKDQYHHTIYEVTGSALELLNVDTTNPLLDKKIATVSRDSVIDFQDLTTIEDELMIYLQDVLDLGTKEVSSLLEAYEHYIARTRME